MPYACASISLAGLSNSRANDTNALVSQIAFQFRLSKPYFEFPIADISIDSTPPYNSDLLHLIELLTKAGYSARLLTSGQHFTDYKESHWQITEMVRLGATRIILRLNPDLASKLSDTMLTNYVSGCIANGINSEVRFEFEDVLPEAFFRVIRRMEELRFYTKIYPVHRQPFRRRPFELSAISYYFQIGRVRLVLADDGSVLARIRDEVQSDFVIGHINSKAPLSKIICPVRFAGQQEDDHEGPAF
jgi:hypothetical protein